MQGRKQRWASTLAGAALLVISLVSVGGAGDVPGFQDSAGEPRTLIVALDGTGEFRSIQEAIDAARNGDTIRIKAGRYPEDVIVHSKERLTIIGESRDRVIVLGRDRFGAFHIGKWPYGAEHIEISRLTIKDRGGLAMGMYNGRGIVLRDVRVEGTLFGQQVQDVRVEQSDLGGSETTGVQFADSEAVLVGNLIHDNDHGVTAAGTSRVRLERNIITRNLFEGVVVTDRAEAVVLSNTIVKNGGGAAFLSESRNEVSGNIIGLNKVGVLIAPSSQVRVSFNALYNTEHDYLRAGSPNVPAPELKSESDLTIDPRFVNPAKDDFRLRADTPLIRMGGFAYLGALEPEKGIPFLPQ
jgi:parallel beta-helix repeat protein